MEMAKEGRNLRESSEKNPDYSVSTSLPRR